MDKITPAADVTTLAGNGSIGSLDGHGSSATFNTPSSVATDADGNIYVLEFVGAVVRKVTPAGDVTTLAGSGTAGFADGTGAAASFGQAHGIATDSVGNVYVADTGNNLLRRITPAGVVSTLAGQPGVLGAQNGIGMAATFKQPYGVTVDATGNLYVADTFGNLIRKVTPIPAP